MIVVFEKYSLIGSSTEKKNFITFLGFGSCDQTFKVVTIFDFSKVFLNKFYGNRFHE